MYIALVKKMYIVNKKKTTKKRKIKKREITGVEPVALHDVVLWVVQASQCLCFIDDTLHYVGYVIYH